MMLPALFGSGDIIADRYEVLHLMHRGGMSNLYKVEHLLSGQSMALKCLSSRFARDAVTRRRLQREGEVLARLQSPHVVRATDFGTVADGAPFLVLEFLEGQDLGRVLGEGRLAVRRSVELVYQACEGVTAVHQAGVVHRDIKPSNLFVSRTHTDSDWVTVLDLGIAKVHQASLLTLRNGVMGTLNYMAPEQLRSSEAASTQADVYALAAVLYHCLSGSQPFKSDNPHRLMQEILYGKCPPLWERAPNIPADLANIVHRALGREPSNRPESVFEFQQLLAPFRPHESTPPSSLSHSGGLSSLHSSGQRAALLVTLDGTIDAPLTVPEPPVPAAAPAAATKAPSTTLTVLSHPLTWLLASVAFGLGFGIALVLAWQFAPAGAETPAIGLAPR